VTGGRAVRAGLAAALAAVALALPGCAPLNSPELKRQAGTVEAVSSEGALLAHQVSLGRGIDNFVRVHAGELMAQADHTVEKLRETQGEDEVPPALAADTDRTIALAQRASDALDRLRLDPGDAAVGGRVERSLDAIASGAEAVAGRI
jgi:hypothetical protein